MLNISEIRINRISNPRNEGFLGYVSILIDNCFIVEGIELHEGRDRRYILMPLNGKNRRNRKNSAYPISEEARRYLLEAISNKYDEE